MQDVKYPDKLQRKFAKTTRRNPDNGCLEWQASLANKGYGMIGITGLDDGGERYKYLAHRVGWLLEYGEFPADGFFLCHSCDNPACCDPAHLFVGTNSDNIQDMHNKGRGYTVKAGERTGELNGRAILTWEAVSAIREAAPLLGWGAQTRLAKQYGVTQSMVNLIINGRAWREESRTINP